MEIERKYLINELPFIPEEYPYTEIEQGYLNTSPVVRVRRDGTSYYLTYKGEGMMAREEYNLPLNKEAYFHLLSKADGRIITKTRYRIPLNEELTVELDMFHGEYEGLVLAEVEFPTVEAANAFTPPDYFGEDVTFSKKYHNSVLSQY